MSGDHNQFQKDKSYLDFECPRCGHCCHVDEPVVGTKTWFEDGKVVTQNLYASDIYKDLPKREWVGLNHFDRTLLHTTHAPLKPIYHDKDISVGAEVVNNWDVFFDAIEAKLKEKNNG